MNNLTNIFRCNDQSALIHNNVASEDPPPGPWSFHSAVQSPLGKVSFPEMLFGVVTVAQGIVCTAGRAGVVEEHALTGHTWLPWLYEGRGRAIRVQRAVTKDVWIGRVQSARRSLLMLQCLASPAVKTEVRRTKNGVLFSGGGFDIEVTLTPGTPGNHVQISDDPALLKRRFAGFDDVQFNEGHCLGYAWQGQKTLWIGAEFRGRIEARFTVVKHGRKPASVSFAAAVKQERRRWEQLFRDEVPPCPTSDPALRDLYYFGWQTLWSNRCEAQAGDLRKPYTSPARLSYGAQWWWDEAITSIGYRHANDPRLGYEGFENFWPLQKKDGWLPGNIRMVSQDTAMSMQPPIIGVALQMLKQRPGWPRDLRRIYRPLLKSAHWHLSPKRDTDRDGLAEYHHCFDGPSDQSPRWDSQKLNAKEVIGKLRPTESVDFNVWMSVLWQVLGEMAERLGDARAAADHARRARRTMELVDEVMWDERAGFYYDVDGKTHRKIPVKTPFGFMPLLSPFARLDRLERVVNEHLLNPREFWCEFPLPSTSLDHPEFDPRNMFRGPTWVNINWMVIEGLTRSGFADEAARLTQKTLARIGPHYRNGRRTRSPRLWEWYHPRTGEPLGNSQYGWTAAIAVDLVLRVSKS